MNNEIRMPRGTSASFAVKIYDSDGKPYEHNNSDVVRMGVKPDENAADYSVQKTGVYNIDNDCYIFNFTPEDTAGLPFDRYWYDIGLQTEDGNYYMIVEASYFYIDIAITAKEVQ